ncbi:hypothetical protein ADUPG1_003691, partial [Aduncisulcus paluster]
MPAKSWPRIPVAQAQTDTNTHARTSGTWPGNLKYHLLNRQSSISL